MNGEFSLIPTAAVEKLAAAEIIRCNELTSRFGLALKESEALELAKTRSDVLEAVGRIEFSGGVINKIIEEFCDSSYLNQSSYAETLNALVEAFYYFKSETLDEMDDDELISIMKQSFEQSCRGSVDLLMSRDLENLSRRIRFGLTDLNDLSKDLSGVFEEDGEPESEEEASMDWYSIFEVWDDGLEW
ncbi:DUF6323 family protein [Anoxybacterium hadale]|uniref:DUF6323 family protein n=1 Tax=Anoxybacterium hadale TaxID=3408580 RepID=UPI003AFFAE52